MDQVKESVVHKGKKYHLLREVFSAEGKLLSRVVEPLSIRVRVQDIFEIIFGAFFIALPFGFTDEVARIGGEMSGSRVLFILIVNVFILSGYIYYTGYQRISVQNLHPHFFLRLFFTYSLAFLVSILVLTIISQAQWSGAASIVALKRALVLALPASFGAVTADTWKKNS